MQAKKFREVIFWMFIGIEGLDQLVSYHTSRLGLDTVTDSGIVSHAVAFAGAAFAFAVYFFLTRRFPEASTRRKWGYVGFIAAFALIVFGFSTQWSAITLGGKEAISIHMQTVLAKSDQQGLQLLRQGSEEANLAPQLNSLANQFEGYAKREAGGAFSGLTGEGDVVATLRNTAQTFRELAVSVEENERNRKKLYEQLKQQISEARDILVSAELDLEQRNIRFSQKLAEINELTTRMSEVSSLEFITTVNRNLSSLTIVVTEHTSQVQREAIKRLQSIIEGAQNIIGQMTDQGELAQVEVQTFTMISMSNAVLKYSWEIAYAWAYALALDFCPLFFIFLLSLGKKEEQTEITLEEAEQIKLDAETMASNVMETAERAVRQFIDELKPEIHSDAEAAQASLNNAAQSVVGQLRENVAMIKKEIELAGADQLRQLKEFKFKI